MPRRLRRSAVVSGPPVAAPQGWQGFPVVRKLEFAYAGAEGAKAGNGLQMLALVAQDLKAHYESVSYEPSLKPVLTVQAKPPLAFSHLNTSPATYQAKVGGVFSSEASAAMLR